MKRITSALVVALGVLGISTTGLALAEAVQMFAAPIAHADGCGGGGFLGSGGGGCDYWVNGVHVQCGEGYGLGLGGGGCTRTYPDGFTDTCVIVRAFVYVNTCGW